MGLPRLIGAEHRGGFRIHFRFTDGADAVVDFESWLDGPVFELLKDPAYFARFFVDGGTVAWPNGADIAPERSTMRFCLPKLTWRHSGPRRNPGRRAAAEPRSGLFVAAGPALGRAFGLASLKGEGNRRRCGPII